MNKNNSDDKAMHTNAFHAAFDLAEGKIRLKHNYLADDYVRDFKRAITTPEGELSLWLAFEQFSAEIRPKIGFSKKGVANTWEKVRRNAFLYLFHLINFQSEDPRIKALFQQNLGQISLAWVMLVCRTNMPPFYYRWAYDAIPNESAREWGPKTILPIMGSIAHMEVFQKLDGRKANHLIVKSVIDL